MKARITLAAYKAYAESRGGVCVAAVLDPKGTPFRCAEGHVWLARSWTIKRNIWCNQCARSKLGQLDRRKAGLEEARAIAKLRGGRCLSTIFVSSAKSLRFVCSIGHRWSAVMNSVKHQGTWCPVCANRVAHGLQALQDEASRRGGSLVSDAYCGAHGRYAWVCSAGHSFTKTWSAVKNRRQWCADCSLGRSTSERICRAVIEFVMKEPFPNSRPKWLKGLSLDGYNERLRIGFEHQGDVHFRPRKYDADGSRLDVVQARDARKTALCQANGVTVVYINELDIEGSTSRVASRVVEAIISAGVRPRRSAKNVDLAAAYIDGDFREFCDIITEKKGILESSFLGQKVAVACWCKEGHLVKVIPSAVRMNTRRDRLWNWCGQCRLAEQLSTRRMSAAARLARRVSALGGSFSESEFVGLKSRMTFSCADGHSWSTTGESVLQQGTWCKLCVSKTRPLKLALDQGSLAR